MSQPTDSMRELVVGTLVAIVKDSMASPAVRVQASRTLAEVLGMLKQAPKAASVSAIEELSEGELDALIASRASQDGTHANNPGPVSAAPVSEPKVVSGKRVRRPRAKRAPAR